MQIQYEPCTEIACAVNVIGTTDQTITKWRIEWGRTRESHPKAAWVQRNQRHWSAGDWKAGYTTSNNNTWTLFKI